MSTPPNTLPVHPDNIPAELKALPQWVGWRWAERGGKWTKPPINVQTGAGAKSNDASTWGDFGAALHSYQNGGRLAGIGFMLAPPFVGVDLDHCRDPKTGALQSWAYAIVQQFGTYSEVSPSGTGVKLICRGDLPVDGTNKPLSWPIEIYRSGRYFALTGHRLEGAPADIRDASEAANWLYNRITTEQPPAWVAPSLVAERAGDDSHRKEKTPQSTAIAPPKPLQATTGNAGAGLTDADLLVTIAGSAQGAKFQRLMAGDTSGYASASQADIALCNVLAFYTDDAGQIDRIFQQSGLWRDKWDERHDANGRTYGQMTIDDALGFVRSRAAYSADYRGGTSTQHEEAPDHWPPELAGEVTNALSTTATATAPRFRLYSARDALKPQPPPTWIVDRLLTPGSVSAVVGAPGSKKTYSLLDMAVCVALGKPWLNLATKQGVVLVIDEESGAVRLARRLGGVLNAHFADESTPVFYTCLAGLNLRQAPEADALQQLITETGAALVIIDALADIMPGADENAVKDVQPLFLALRRVADKTGAAIVLIHHSGKNGDYRGSSAIKGAVDLMLTVESKSDEAVVRFSFEKARDTEPFTFAGQSHFSDGLFWLSATDAEPVEKLSQADRYVLRFLKENGPSTTAEIKAHADSCTAEQARKAVLSLADRGLVRRTDAGGQGTAATYALAE